MFVCDGLFHADLNPGNIFLHPDGTFTLLDLGMVGELTTAQRDQFILYWFAVVQRQTRRAFRHFKAETRRLPQANEEAFFVRFEQLLRPFIAREYAARTASLDLLKKRHSQLAPELLLGGEFLPPQAVDETWDWNATVELFNELRVQFGGMLQSALERGRMWQMLVKPHARAVLNTTPLGESTGDLLKQAWDRYYKLEPSIAIKPTLGAVFTTHLVAATLALHEVLLRHGISAAESERLIFFEPFHSARRATNGAMS